MMAAGEQHRQAITRFIPNSDNSLLYPHTRTRAWAVHAKTRSPSEERAVFTKHLATSQQAWCVRVVRTAAAPVLPCYRSHT